MQANIWYELGITYAAFKAICKGIPSGFSEVKAKNSTVFDNKNDHYSHFNSLLSHLDSYKHLDSMALVSNTKIFVSNFTFFFSMQVNV